VKVILCNSIIHIDIGKRRNANDEDVYEERLRAFIHDRDYDRIIAAIERRDFLRAERVAQRLKIKAYNLGMVRLAKNCDTLCLAIQDGKGAPEFSDAINDVTVVYEIMRDCLDRAFSPKAEKPTKGRLSY